MASTVVDAQNVFSSSGNPVFIKRYLPFETFYNELRLTITGQAMAENWKARIKIDNKVGLGHFSHLLPSKRLKRKQFIIFDVPPLVVQPTEYRNVFIYASIKGDHFRTRAGSPQFPPRTDNRILQRRTIS